MHVRKQMHEICFWGQGGYNLEIVYNMPIWWREFTYRQLKEYYSSLEKKKENINNTKSSPKISKPNIPLADYSTKASKK